MGYADKFYFGQCKIETASTATVTDGTNTWQGSKTYTLPGSKKYTVTANGITKDVYADYGAYIYLDM